MTQKILLRKAQLADAIDISNIYLSSRKKFIVFAPLKHSDEDVCRWVCEILIPQSQVIVAEKDGIIIAMMALSKKEGVGFIDQLYVSVDYNGQGVGTLLVNKAKSILGSPIRLRTFQENIGARRFYEKNGFQILELSDGSKNEENCPDILFEWRVT